VKEAHKKILCSLNIKKTLFLLLGHPAFKIKANEKGLSEKKGKNVMTFILNFSHRTCIRKVSLQSFFPYFYFSSSSLSLND
jgi:hypothetical protein